MKRLYLLIFTVIFAMCHLYSQHRSADLNVIFSVPEINAISIIEPSIIFDLNYGGASGFIYEPRTVNARYNISCTGTNKKILASLNQSMPNHMTLELRADAPANAISMGPVPLTASPQVIVSNISHVHQSHLLLFFRLRAELGAPVGPNQTRVVTFTISD